MIENCRLVSLVSYLRDLGHLDDSLITLQVYKILLHFAIAKRKD